jgi:cytoskeletal protein CcmA (bactofilin family)
MIAMHFAWALCLFALTILMFSVPLWPALWELRRKDIRTLPIDRSDDGTAAYAASLEQAGEAEIPARMVLAQGTVSREVVCALEHIRVQPGCEFTWLDARAIEFVGLDLGAQTVATTNPATPQVIDGVREKFQRIKGHWQIPPSEQVRGDYVVTEDVLVAQDAIVLGNIKAYGNVHLSAGAVVHGSVFAKKQITLESGAVVFGVVSAGQQISLSSGSVVGHATQLSSVTAPRVLAHAGALVHGSVKAQTLGTSQA